MPAFAGMTKGAQLFALGKLTPRSFRRGVLPGDFSRYETFDDTSCL
jgi:hypothetical protein